MRHTAQDRPIAMTSPPPDITAVSVVRHGVLRLTFADGLTGDVDDTLYERVLTGIWPDQNVAA